MLARRPSACLSSLLLLVTLLVLAMAPATAAQPVLRVLAWPGYAEQEVVKSFEQQHGVRVELTVITSDASLWEKINTHSYDVFAVNAAELQRYLAANLVQPLHPEDIPNASKQLSRFRDLVAIPGLMRNGKAYAIPFTYSQMGLIYDRKQFKTPPHSANVLWDKRYRGKVIAYDGGTHNFSLAAQSLRLASPFQISPKDFPRATSRLIELRRNALGFYTQPEESAQLFLRHGAALMFANYGMQQVHLLKEAGADIGYVIPQEGALAWLDCWSITRDAQDIKLAHDWIDHLLGPQASRFLIERQGLSNTMSDGDNGQPEGKSVWLQPPEDTVWREKLWSRIRSGDRLSRVLAQ
ncbi:MAG: extracellular solute-binding protein [Gammaproteobacteria bacterium]|nr:extracellular solute-binding protein [Gammaproteobacteria bacterium]MBU1624398.1 extracellular solute-binding protein [Gammaproteobacteria bacterium]MBU1981126.1 extracellular solute-binding protein [Gammaproteobacteria bacterium]